MFWRYRGDPSMWAWLLHRLTGVGIFVFLLVHVVDTSLILWSRELYDKLVKLYHHPVFKISEILLFGAVLFHGLNGLRVVVLDFAPQTTVYQRQMLAGVAIAFFLLFIPVAIIMFGQMMQGAEKHFGFEINPKSWQIWLPALLASVAIFSVYAPTMSAPKLKVSIKPSGGLELYGWLFIRVSGILLIFLAIGHLVIMHLIDGGVNRINSDFVAQRLANPIWRTYDFLLLTLAITHGTWGMRTVLMDYFHKPSSRLIILSLLYVVAGIVTVLGALTLFTFQP
ncbi:MAG: succinate dehydrogenase, cytochrome b556 subunit [Armatimonadetes bacterium]|nr:succinate dehydrogenase, cytochrome b556 subunit [Armatimonadota bacterium]